ncbi:MAG: hypothetical protein EXS51_02395 [Candidatus Taylorbacteria bacterium]|nr:hypothetical protein [Candidatus Taylorbacteria bacterium]
MKKLLFYPLALAITLLIVPQITLAVWWKPSTWFRSKPVTHTIQTQNLTATTTLAGQKISETNKLKEETVKASTKAISDNSALIQAEVQKQVKAALKAKADEEARIAQQKANEQAKIDAAVKAALKKQATQQKMDEQARIDASVREALDKQTVQTQPYVPSQASTPPYVPPATYTPPIPPSPPSKIPFEFDVQATVEPSGVQGRSRIVRFSISKPFYACIWSVSICGVRGCEDYSVSQDGGTVRDSDTIVSGYLNNGGYKYEISCIGRSSDNYDNNMTRKSGSFTVLR